MDKKDKENMQDTVNLNHQREAGGHDCCHESIDPRHRPGSTHSTL